MLIKTKSPLFFNYIKWRTAKQKNFLCTCIGQTGSGKSYTNLKAMEILNPHKKPEDIIKNTCFSGLEFLERLNSGELKRGDCLTWDEVGIGLSSKDWQSMSNKLINFILQTFRHLGLVVFFNTPSFSFIDASSRRLFHSIWETVGINYVNERCEVKPLLLQVDSRTGKVYFKYLRVNDDKHGQIPVKRLYLSLPSKELRVLYEAKKKKFTTKLSESILEELQELEAKKGKSKPLTERQQEVLDLISSGLTTKQVASKLGVSREAIQGTIGFIRKKGVTVALNLSKRQKTPKISPK